MKKIIVLFVFMFAGLGLMAQNQLIDVNISGFGAVNNNTTTLSKKTAAYSYVFGFKNLKAPYLYTYSVRLQDLGGTLKNNSATVVLSGSLDGYEYKTITTIALSAKAVPADTALIGNITSAPLSYKYLKFTVTPSDTIWVPNISLNIAPNTLP